MWFEFMLAIASQVHEKGLRNVMVSNGFISDEPLEDLIHVIDAFNIDLKGFTQEFYRSFTGASLQPVLQSLKKIRLSGRHLEVTTLIIPGINDGEDDFKRMISWIADELGPSTVFHLSRYHPAFRLGLDATPAESLEKLLEIAHNKLHYVYAGNILLKNYQDTRCHKCHDIVIKRTGYYISKIAITENGLCMNCKNQIIVC
jgi:pyruvate formate lyase activating enzyme